MNKQWMKRFAITTTLAVTLTTTSVLPSFHSLTVMAQSESATINSSVNFRTGPTTNSSIVRSLKAGESVTILEATNANWFKIQDANGRVGYVSSGSKYISRNGSGGSSSPSTPVVDSSSTSSATILYGVNMRSGPSSNYSRIRTLQKGESVTIIGQASTGWYQIRDSSGKTGYVSSASKYISVTSNNGGNGNNNGTGTTPGASQSVEAVIAAGMKYIGTPYQFGSNRNSTASFDCSAFVRQAFKDALGITLPGDSRKQASYVKDKGNYITNWKQLKRGDLMFFMDYKGSTAGSYSGINKANQRISHVGIYLGDGKILHTYSVSSGGVRTDSIAGKHWEYRFVFGGSAL